MAYNDGLSDQRLKYHRQRCQARFRSEPWAESFTFEQWWEIWRFYWDQRGRNRDDLVLVRVDTAKPWSKNNVKLRVRREWLSECNLGRPGGPGRPRKRLT